MAKPVKAIGIECPFIREGDDIATIVVNSLIESGEQIDDLDVIGITESVVARAQGNYVTVDEIVDEIRSKFGEHPTLMLYKPIYSRNRFSVILRAFARACDNLIIVMPEVDEVGNVVRKHPFTGLDYDEYYKKICVNEDCLCYIVEGLEGRYPYGDNFYQTLKKHPSLKVDGIIDCMLHNNGISGLCFSSAPFALYPLYTLYDFCSDKCEWGLLGSNKVNDEKLKLFPSKGGAQAVCDIVKDKFLKITGKNVVVCVYGDGCFKAPSIEVNGKQTCSVWEFADPVTCPGYTDKALMESSPNEIKLKALIDNAVDDNEVHVALSKKTDNDLKNEKTMGTTPRLRKDLLASLMDLVTGSGMRGTPFVLVKNYFL